MSPTNKISDIKYKLYHAPNHEKPAPALILSLHYRDEDYESSVKYASLVIEMIDSLDPSDLIGPFKEFIADNRELTRHVYLNIIHEKYKFDKEYQLILDGYRAEQSAEEKQLSEVVAKERKKVISYFYK